MQIKNVHNVALVLLYHQQVDVFNVYQVVVLHVMLVTHYYVLDVQSDSNQDKENVFVVHFIVRNVQVEYVHNVILAINYNLSIQL
jgi:hypothetical protein